MTVGGFVRHDQYNYYPSDNPSLTSARSNLNGKLFAQIRFLTNAGARASVSYVKGIHNIKAGVVYEQTFLTENDNFGIVDPTLNAPCLAPATGPSPFAFVPVAGFSDPSECPAGDEPNTAANLGSPAQLGSVLFPNFDPILLPYDLTRGGATVHVPWPHRREGACSVRAGHDHQGNWSFNLGIRGDIYNGLTRQARPSLGSASPTT